MPTYFDELGWYVKIVQTCAAAEILHSAVGLVRSPIFSTIMQVGSRLFLVWGISELSVASQLQFGYLLMVVSWSLVEIPRYAYYALAIIGKPPSFLTWLRYTLFIVLYPSGISGEILTILSAMPHIKETKPYSISMPNSMNFAFDYYYLCLILLATYLPGSPFMFSHMWQQRKKILGADHLKVKSH
jgi:very-long-chain (3R)-3-hydroxyacyl-CoA dehydratase